MMGFFTIFSNKNRTETDASETQFYVLLDIHIKLVRTAANFISFH